jgi:hypothetical protein
MNFSSPERKSRKTCKPEESLSINAALVPISIAHPSFISWWQELHDHIFNEPVHSFCLEVMPDFQPTSEVIHLLSSFLKHIFPYWS